MPCIIINSKLQIVELHVNWASHLLFFYYIFQYDLPFVEVHRTTQFTFQALPSPARNSSDVSVWNCDGEVLVETTLHIRYIVFTFLYFYGFVKRSIHSVFLSIALTYKKNCITVFCYNGSFQNLKFHCLEQYIKYGWKLMYKSCMIKLFN